MTSISYELKHITIPPGNNEAFVVECLVWAGCHNESRKRLRTSKSLLCISASRPMVSDGEFRLFIQWKYAAPLSEDCSRNRSGTRLTVVGV